ncbi:hypothetical protein HanRHA438_Chr02g0089891 [Helianthus annuus]|nr:hypothetical protein HanRHA438_Chr02g0089891 [Helianthus annuus]
MLEKPSAKNRNRPLRQSSLGSPSIMLDHTQLLQSSLLPELIIHKFQPRTAAIGLTTAG